MNRESQLLKGLAAGAIGGLMASWVMDEFQYAWVKVASGMRPNGSDESSSDNHKDQSQSSAEEQEPATIKAAEIVSEEIFGHQLAKEEKKIAGDVVHYAIGGASGAVYGVAAELAREVKAGIGLPFGTVVWLIVDEGSVPLTRPIQRADRISAFHTRLCARFTFCLRINDRGCAKYFT
jgi:hypothetical protein